MNEQDIVYNAMKRLAAQTGVHADWIPLHQEIDGEILLHFNGNNLHAFAAIKKTVKAGKPEARDQVFDQENLKNRQFESGGKIRNNLFAGRYNHHKKQ